MFAGTHADVAVLQQRLANEAFVDAGRDPAVGHDFAGLAQAVLRFFADDLGTLDDSVLRLLGAIFGLFGRGLRRGCRARRHGNGGERQQSEERDDDPCSRLHTCSPD